MIRGILLDMESSTIAIQINGQIILWSKEKDKLVIAIDGYTGIGKTTLLNNLISINSEIIPVNRDDFLLSRKIVKEKLTNAKDKSEVFELEVCDIDKLTGLIRAFKNGEKSYTTTVYDYVSGEVKKEKEFDLLKNIMVVEGVFMFHPKLSLNNLWDKKIYLEGNISQIDKRRIKREKEKWDDNYFPETHPDSYFKQVTIALQRYINLYKPQDSADLVIKVDF